MKKAISLITAMLMMLAFAVSPAYAADETVEKSFTTTAKQAYDFSDFGDLSGDTVVEVDYDFTETNFSDFDETAGINIPFVFKNEKGEETSRFSIFGDTVGTAKTKKYLRTEFEFVNPYTKPENPEETHNISSLFARNGFVEEKGKLIFLFSKTDKKLYVHYKGENIKTEAFMGYCPFTYIITKTTDDETQETTTTYTQREAEKLGTLTIGASACPEVKISLKAYKPDNAEEYKIPHTKYTYDSDFEGPVANMFGASGYDVPIDFKNTNTAYITIEKGTNGNGYIKIPAGKQYSLMFVPQGQGMEQYADYTYIKYKQYIANDNPNFTGTNTTSVSKYIGADAALAIKSKTSLKFVNQEITVPDMTGKWTEIMRVFDKSKKTVALYVDGEKYTTQKYSGEGLDYMLFMFDTDMYIDDLEMGKYIPTLADNTFKESFTVATTKTENKDISGYNLGNKFIVDIDYDLSDSSVTTGAMSGLNIPFALMNGNTEAARYSIQDSAESTSQYFSTNFNQGGTGAVKTLGGLVGRTGNIKMLVKLDAQKFSVKYTGTGYKTEQYMGTMPFENMIEGITGVKIGAGGNPGVKINLKVYPADDAAVTAFEQYKTVYTYDEAPKINAGYLDFKASDNGITIENGAVKIPQGKAYNLMLTPQEKGYTGKFTVKYKVKNIGENAFSNNRVFVTNYGGTCATGTSIYQAARSINLWKAGSSWSAVSGDPVTFETPYALTNDWIEFKQVIDLNKHTVDLYMDGWHCATVTIDSSLAYINCLRFTFSDTDVYIDDVVVENYTDDTVKNTAKLNIETLTNGDYKVRASYVDVNSTKGAMLVTATYNAQNKLVQITKVDMADKDAATISGKDITKVKAFLWEDGSIRPLATAKEIVKIAE